MKRKKNIKILDIAIIFLAVCLTGFSFLKAYIQPQKTSQVLIKSADQNWIFPLDAEETITASGPIGNTVIRIHNGEAWIESSPCANQTCVAAGHISRQGVWTACLPNNVFLMIEGSDEEASIDSVVW
ncbi:MAG: NusG domain II-containing protein [Treponema sp.]|nr:NusG domain II-containing protein [Treponema sp.]